MAKKRKTIKEERSLKIQQLLKQYEERFGPLKTQLVKK